MTTIGDALFTKTQQRVLALLYGNAGRSYYTNEIVRWAGMGRGTVRRELERLLSAGLLVMRREGNQQYYQANPDSPVFNELRGIVLKTFGVVEVLREALLPLSSDIELAAVYGSMASGEELQGSDIDLLVVGKVTFEEIVTALYPCQEILGREINPNLFTPDDFMCKMNEKDSFVAQVMAKQKLIILGKEDDAGKSGKDQQTQTATGK